ncbi:unnamed protein product [Allacma fusca]|uniref:Uncharacterized protein n=1 Tax=Allacma fusca TaxID=39272 RepID=A0A8J2PN56_9HEXA|nr:unnamed protein product [Allacma fusca]
MASPAVGAKSCECACEKAPGRDSSCVCTVPCAFNSESKTFNWVCDCKSFKCKFQIRCNNKDQPCSASDTELFTLKCHCEKLECSLQIWK